MDDFDLLGDFPTGFEEMLDAGDLADPDLNVLELTGGGGVAAQWQLTAAQMRHAAEQVLKVKDVLDVAGDVVGDSAQSAVLRTSLDDVRALPSPFRER